MHRGDRPEKQRRRYSPYERPHDERPSDERLSDELPYVETIVLPDPMRKHLAKYSELDSLPIYSFT